MSCSFLRFLYVSARQEEIVVQPLRGILYNLGEGAMARQERSSALDTQGLLLRQSTWGGLIEQGFRCGHPKFPTMDWHYEASAVEVWLHSTGRAAVVGVAGPAAPSEAGAVASAERSGAGWTAAELVSPDGVETVLTLGVAGQTGTQEVTLWFAVRAPTEQLLQALAVPEGAGGMALLGVYRNAAHMRRLMSALKADPALAATDHMKAEAIYYAAFTVAPGTLDKFM